MGIADIIILCVMGAIFLFMIRLFCKTGRPLVSAIGNMSMGFLGLVGINLTASVTSVSLTYNIFTVCTSLVLGLPGVISLMVVKLMWGIA